MAITTPEKRVKHIRGLAEAARQIARQEKSTDDYVLDWMYSNLPSKEWTLQTYISLAFFGDKTIDDLDAEQLAELPEELNRF
jgi:hypothetical protein